MLRYFESVGQCDCRGASGQHIKAVVQKYAYADSAHMGVYMCSMDLFVISDYAAL